jgi:hypothetical protein
MLGNYFYNATIRRIVSVFGTLFNNIKVARFGSNASSRSTDHIHVPISYGPKEKFLARIRSEVAIEAKSGIAIKLPRMSFEMTGIDYDTGTKLNKLNRRRTGSISNNTQTTHFQSVPYNIGMQLNIFAKTQDDALQIVEQILPTFAPEYTVTIKDIDGPGSKTDVPFILNGVSFTDDYEGDVATRRTITYTLDFQVRAKFAPGVGRSAIIKRVNTTLADFDILTNENQSPKESIFSQVSVSIDSPTANQDDSPSKIKTFISFINPEDTYKVVFDDSPAFTAGQQIIGLTSAVGGVVTGTGDSPGEFFVNSLEGLFTAGETIRNDESPFISGTFGGSIDIS